MIKNRLLILRQRMTASGIDGVLVTSREHVFYLSGFTGDAGDLFITHDAAYVLCDARFTEQAAQQTCETYTVTDTKDGIYKILDNLILYHRIIRLGIEDREITHAVYTGMKSSLPRVTLIPLRDMISSMRIIKDASELEILEQAAAIGDLAYKSVLSHIKLGVSEVEIAAEIEYVMRKNGASSVSFETIVASGKNSSKPHATASEKKIEHGDLVTMDFGCIYKGYCSDMTRTVAVGEIGRTEKMAYDAVLFAQLKITSMIAAGKSCSELDKISRNVLDNLGYGKYFTHSLGHGVGINVHELPNLSSKSAAVLASGMVVTVEPGVYFENNFGIRIEDTVCVLPNEAKIITTSPKDLVIIQ